MSDIVVNTTKLTEYATRIGNVNDRLSKLDKRFDSLYLQVGLEDGLSDAWNLLQADIFTSYSTRLSSCKAYLESVASDFETVESELAGYNPESFVVPKSTLKAFLDGDFKYEGTSFLVGVTGKASISLGNLGYEDKKIIGEKTGLNVDQHKINYKQENADENWYKSKGTILEIKEEGSLERSLYSHDFTYSDEYSQGTLNINAANAEAHVKVSAGLYVYEKDENGNVKRVLSPGVSAEVGASVSALSVDGSYRLGLGEDNNLAGVYVNAEAEALSAEGKLKASLSLDEVYLGASAEANLVKVSAAAGVSVLGADIGVTGSLKVGIGAHAEVGYTDGKFKVDIGAAVGVGFDLGFEVDVSGVVDAVTDVSESILNGASEVVDAVSSSVSKVADAVSSGVSKVADDISELASGISSVFKSWFK